MFIKIPTWTGSWDYTEFNSHNEFRDFVVSLFKLPGEYDFDETAFLFNEQARLFNKNKQYCQYPEWTKDFRDYWDFEKEKCRYGVIFKNNNRTWYLPREYYMWINFLPIYDKKKKVFDFPEVWDSQYHVALYELLAELHYKHASIVKKRQFGSEQPHSEPVLSSNGWYTMGDVREGDKLWNPDGTLTTVIHKINNGIKDVYTFKFIDGRSTRCGIDHNWEVIDRTTNKKKVLTTKDLIATGLLKSQVTVNGKFYNSYRYAIESIEPLNFNHSIDPVINPYILGLIIGDGSCGGKTVGITTNDLFIKNKISELIGEDYILKEDLPSVKTTARRWILTYKKRFNKEENDKYENGKYGVNPIIRQLKELKLQGKTCYTKFIPEQVLNASLDYRISCLQGLMDSDGYVNEKGLDIHYTTCNFKLASDVAFLARSLGIKCIIKDVTVKGEVYKRVRMSGNIKIDLFLLPRKKERFDKRKNKHLFEVIPIVEIIKENYQEESSCIVVDNPNHLYITKDYLVTHNSYFHAAKMINLQWFEQGPVIKIGASQEKFINAKGTWKFLNEYRSFLNKETAWYRPMNPGQVLMWQQQIEDTDDEGRTSMRGLKGTIQGVTFDTDPTNGVGGACHSKGTKILTSSGSFKNVEDFKVGDFILGIDNKPKRVIRTFKGFDDIYEVIQKRGDSYECTGDHLLYLNNRDAKVESENKLRLTKVKDWNNLTTYQKRVFVGSKNNKILEFENKVLPPQIDPYFIGLWLGDGYRANNSIIVNKTKDCEIYDYLNDYIFNLVGEVNCNRKEEKRYADEIYIISCPISINNEDTPITKQFVKYNLYYNKHIPDDILYGNSTTRLNVLAGLIDSDGYYNAEKQMFVLSAKNENFISQVEQLCRSLGGVTYRRVIPSAEHELNGRTIKYTETNELKVYFDNITIPTKVKRKQGIRQFLKNIHSSPIEDVVYKGKSEYYGIEVEDHLYYLKDLTITHNCTLFFYEEAGIARTMDVTIEYLFPAMELGDITTGLFVAAGSVGELDDCEPLKKMTYKPRENQIYPVTTDLIDENRTIGEHGMFVPEQWSMPPYIDQYGNSLVEQAFNALTEKYEEWKRDLAPEIARLRISQHPRFLSEAFDYREDSVFPTHLVKAQKKRIQDKYYPYQLVDLIYNDQGKVESIPTTKLPISEFPFSMKAEDKSGSIVVWEEPIKDAPWGTYFASIDPVSEGKTLTSKSLCSIYVYKNPIQVTKITDGEPKTYVTRDQIVCAWTGRFDDLTETHKRLEKIIEWYNAWTVVEANVSQFILYMMDKKKQKYLVPQEQMLFFKELSSFSSTFQTYGWKNTGTVFKAHILNYLIDYCSEIIEQETKADGEVVRTTYGIERIPDIMAMEEMLAYKDKLNVDRIVALAALIAFAKVQQANVGLRKMIDDQDSKKLQNRENFSKLYVSPFRHIGNNNSSGMSSPKRSPFKNYR